MLQLIFHLVGDFVTQSHWMAENKTKSSKAAIAHALIYSLPFKFIASWPALIVIFATHFLIDRYRLARIVCYLKNILLHPHFLRFENLGPDDREEIARLRWLNCRDTGYPSDVNKLLAVVLMIACDNTLHLAINYAAIRWL